MSQTVIGLFNETAQATNAESRLLQAGFTNAMIDVSRGEASELSSETDRERRVDPDDADDGPVTRFFKNLFTSDADAERYTSVARHSEAIVTVHVDSSEAAQRAARVLDDAGAVDVDEQATQYDSDRRGDETLKVIEENLQVGKRTVETGGARIRSRIVERAVEQDIRLRHERVTVQRHPVDRVATAADLQAFREGQVVVVEHAEVPVVAKETRVVEEVSLKKEQGERTETVRDTVRKTEVEVDDLSSTNASRPRDRR